MVGECVRPGARLVDWHMRSTGARADVSGYPPVTGFNELKRVLEVAEVRVDGCRQRRRDEVSERHEEPDRRSVLVSQVLQVKGKTIIPPIV